MPGHFTKDTSDDDDDGFPGTDATHADHIETIKSRMYVGLTDDQRFLPGELGMGLVEGREKDAHTHTHTHINNANLWSV